MTNQVLDTDTLNALIDLKAKTYTTTTDYSILREHLGFSLLQEVIREAHFPVLVQDGSKLFVNYFESPQKFLKGVTTKIKLGRYVKKVWPECLNSTIDLITNSVLAELNKASAYKLTFSLPVTSSNRRSAIADYWREVYKTPLYADPVSASYKSCMTNKFAVGAYACEQDDLDDLLLLATLLDADNNIVSRTIVFGRDRTLQRYLKIYSADPIAHCLMINELAKYNIVHNANLGGFCIWADDIDHGFPYVDGRCNELDDLGSHFYKLTSSGNFGICDNINGSVTLVDDNDYYPCDCCGERTYYEDLHSDDWGELHICEDCIGDRYVYATRYSSYGDDSVLCSRSDTVEINGELYLDDSDSLSSLGFIYVDYDSEWVSKDNAVWCETIEEYCLGEDAIELDSDLYPNLDSSEATYPDWSSEVILTALNRWIIGSDRVTIGDKWFHPYECCLCPDTVYGMLATNNPYLNAGIIKTILAIRAEHAEDYSYETGKVLTIFDQGLAFDNAEQLSTL